MKTNEAALSRRMSLVWSAVSWAGGLLIAGLIGWLWFVVADDYAAKAVLLVAILALAALIGITSHESRARARRELQAALDAYAEQEQAKWTYSHRSLHARPHWQDR
jgi:hypothetical protein